MLIGSKMEMDEHNQSSFSVTSLKEYRVHKVYINCQNVFETKGFRKTRLGPGKRALWEWIFGILVRQLTTNNSSSRTSAPSSGLYGHYMHVHKTTGMDVQACTLFK